VNVDTAKALEEIREAKTEVNRLISMACSCDEGSCEPGMVESAARDAMDRIESAIHLLDPNPDDSL
jgi:hypothetical protein